MTRTLLATVLALAAAPFRVGCECSGSSARPDGGAAVELSLADPATGSTLTTSSHRVDVQIANDSRATWWCLSETQSPAGAACDRGQGPDRGGFTARPATFMLSPGDGTKRVFLRLEPAGAAEAVIEVTGSPPPITFHRLPEVISFSHEAATRVSGGCTEIGGKVDIVNYSSTPCTADGGWAITFNFAGKPDGTLTLRGTQTNAAGTSTSPYASKTLLRDTAACRAQTARSGAPFAAGTGDAGDPFVVCTPAQLFAIDPIVPAAISLRDDLDLTDAGSPNWLADVTGTLDGHGFIVSGLFIPAGSGGSGLIRVLSGTVRGVNVVDANVTGDTYVGLLVGTAQPGSRIVDCHTSGRAQVGADHAGGLVGSNHGDVEDSSSSATVVGGFGIGVGGLIGHHYLPGVVRRCFATGPISGRYSGGLIGRVEGAVEDSYATGDVTTLGQTTAGGFAGEIITNGVATRTFSTGRVENVLQSGGFTGFVSGSVDASYWDIETSGRTDSASGIGLTHAQMTDAGSFEGWDFVNVWRLEPQQAQHPLLRTQ